MRLLTRYANRLQIACCGFASLSLFVTYLRLVLILCCLTFQLTAYYDQSKEEELIAHVQNSIEQAQKGVSKLSDAVLKIQGFSSPMVRHFLNNVCSMKNTTYLEIGCFKGSTFVSAGYGNKDSLLEMVGIDNWSGFGGPREAFYKNASLMEPGLSWNFFESDCFALDITEIISHPINVYFYDGSHSSEHQKAAFTYYNPIFDDVFIAIVDDWNWSQVRSGTLDAFQELNYEILYKQEFFTNKNGGDKDDWWNGLLIAVIKK
ncbi:MAG: hypothetical protein ABSA17_03105 [Rhabdochlamydiaceae bacterium]|jgi:hypothetical protein